MDHFYLRVKPSPFVKVVISVSKKVAKKAVTRNKIKRRVRPIVRLIVPKLRPGEYFLVAKSGSADVKGEELQNELKALFKI